MKNVLFILACLMAATGCGEEAGAGTEVPALDFNLAVIDGVSEPSEEGLRTIVVNFFDKDGNSLDMKTVSSCRHLEAGWYAVTDAADERLEAEMVLNTKDGPVSVTGGSVSVNRKNHEYTVRFDLETDKGCIRAAADRKKLYFESEEYPSVSAGADGLFLADLTIHSKILNSLMKYSVYLPGSYDGNKEYPVLYILHGMGGNNNDWLQDNTASLGGGAMPAYAAELAERTGKELIIVSPEGRNLFYCNGYEPGVNYMSYFFEEFIPFIESEYAIRGERSSRAIGGLSMGGYGSLYYGLLHPEMFCHIYACSAAVSVGGAAPDLTAFLAEASASGDVRTLPELTMEIGTEDFLFSNNESFVRTLDSYGVPYEYITRGGVHDWRFWNACSPKILHKVTSIFN